MAPCDDCGEDMRASADDAARPLAGGGRRAAWPGFEAARGDFEAGDALFAGDRRRRAGAHGLQKAISSARSGSSWPTEKWRIE